MQLQEIYSEIQQRAGDNGLTQTQMGFWVNAGIQQWAKDDYPDTLATDSSNITASGTTEYPLPSDTLKVLSIRVGSSSTATEDDATEYSFVRYENKNVDTTENVYYINPTNGKVGLLPQPTSSGLPIFIKYHATPATLSVLTDEPPFPKPYHEALIYFALKKYWETQDEFDKSIYYDTEWNRMLEDMKVDLLKQSRGQLGAMRDIRDLQYQNQPWTRNSIER